MYINGIIYESEASAIEDDYIKTAGSPEGHTVHRSLKDSVGYILYRRDMNTAFLTEHSEAFLDKLS